MEEERKEPIVEETTEDTNSESTLYAVLAYLWILCLVPILLKKNDEFVMFHARQGLMIFIVVIGVGIFSIIPAIGPVIYLLGMLACGLVSLFGIVQVLMGNRWEVPILGEWSKKLKI